MDRRTFLRGATVLVGLGAASAVAGCAPTSPETAMTPSNTSPRPSSPSAAPGSDSRILLAYFSRPGENYYYGDRIDLQVGNTQVVAEMIPDSLSVDVYRIEAADPYSDDYDDTVARNVREQAEDARPAIANPLPAMERYDTVLLGSPIWNMRAPMIMRTFIEGAGLLAGKTVLPFVTYAVSGMSGVDREYARLCPDATVGEGFAVQGEKASDAGPDVARWLRDAGLPT